MLLTRHVLISALACLALLAPPSAAQDVEGPPPPAIGDEEAAAVLERLAAEEPMLRMEAAMVILDLGPAAPDSLIQGLAAQAVAETDVEIRSLLLQCLDAYPERLAVLVPALLPGLKHADLALRARVALLLAPLGAEAPPEVAQVLTGLLDAEDSPFRLSAATALAGVDPERATPVLVAFLAVPDGASRMVAAEALGRIQATGGVPALIACLRDEAFGWAPRTAAALALGACGAAAKAAIPDLVAVLEAEPVRPGRHGVGIFLIKPHDAALIALVKIDPSHERVLAAVRKQLLEGDRETLTTVGPILTELDATGQAAIVPALVLALEGQDMLRVGEVAKLLGRLGDAGRPAVPALGALVARILPKSQGAAYRPRYACVQALEALGRLGHAPELELALESRHPEVAAAARAALDAISARRED